MKSTYSSVSSLFPYKLIYVSFVQCSARAITPSHFQRDIQEEIEK
jgi:hypothetical protein